MTASDKETKDEGVNRSEVRTHLEFKFKLLSLESKYDQTKLIKTLI